MAASREYSLEWSCGENIQPLPSHFKIYYGRELRHPLKNPPVDRRTWWAGLTKALFRGSLSNSSQNIRHSAIMWKMLLCLLPFLVSFLGTVAQEDLETRAFVFPMTSKTAYVVLNATAHEPLTDLTLCMRFYTDLTRGYSLFSYASKRSANEFLLFMEKPNTYGFYLGPSHVEINVPGKFNPMPGREHVCTSWESSTGLVELWVNGHPLVRRSFSKGRSVNTEASIILGQEQDSFGGGFDIDESFTGEITDVNMWDRVLSPDDVIRVSNNADITGNLINWRSLSYQIKGDVIVKPALPSSLSSY